MKIDKLSSEQGNKFVTVTMSYEDARDISNALYEIQKMQNKYKGTYVKAKTVFDMVKHGMVQPETIAALHDLEKERNTDDSNPWPMSATET